MALKSKRIGLPEYPKYVDLLETQQFQFARNDL